MKIQWHENDHFSLTSKTASVAINPQQNHKNDVVCYTAINPEENTNEPFSIALPGEFEVSDVLIKVKKTPNENALVYRFFIDEISVVFFSGLENVPETSFIEGLGESVDIAIVALSEKFNAAAAKKLLGEVQPRITILGGDKNMIATSATTFNINKKEENPISVSRSGLPSESTEVWVLC